jgi:hypothetical protein
MKKSLRASQSVTAVEGTGFVVVFMGHLSA